MNPDQPNPAPPQEGCRATASRSDDTVQNTLKSLELEMRVQSLAKTIRDYSGEGSRHFHDWVKDVEKAGIALNADDQRYKSLVLQTLRGPAGDFVTRLIRVDPNIPWPGICQALYDQYSDINDTQLAIQKLRRLTQNAGESIQNFAMRVMVLADDAYAGHDMNNPLIQSALIETLVDGVRDNGVARKLIRENPDKFEKAVAVAEQQATRAFNIRRREEPMDVNLVSQDDSNSEITQRLDKLVDAVGQLLVKDKNSKKETQNKGKQGGKTRFKWTEDGKPICHYCGKIGHTQSKCFSKKKAEKQKSEN